MSCFSWSPRFGSSRRGQHHRRDESCSPSRFAASAGSISFDGGGGGGGQGDASVEGGSGQMRRSVGGTTHKFTLRQLAAATDNFREANLVGEGGFGRVYKGRLDATGQVVAIKQLNRGGVQGNQEFLVECMMLMMLHHPNLVSLIGYCAEAHDRLLVYEFMPHASLDAHLFDSTSRPLDWNTRIKIAYGSAKGLCYLHEVVTPPVIYRDLKSSNILLDQDFTPKLSDLGLAKLGPVGDDTHVSTRVMGTYGYCAPDYAMSGKLNVKSDVYSFGVVLLELITGRRAFDTERPLPEQRLLLWAQPYLAERQKYFGLADPSLQGRYPRHAFYQLVVITSLCLHDKPNLRPTMADVTVALEHVASQPYNADAVGHHRRRASTDSLASRRSDHSGAGDDAADEKIDQ